MGLVPTEASGPRAPKATGNLGWYDSLASQIELADMKEKWGKKCIARPHTRITPRMRPRAL